MPSMPVTLCPDELERCLSVRDLTDPAQGPHACQIIVDAIAEAIASAWGCEVRLIRSQPVVTIADNYEHLDFPADAITRDARYTRYVDADRMLRSHTTAAVPGALRQLADEAAHHAAPDDVVLVCPGICYRRDSVDWQHSGTPHQLDLWRLRRTHVVTEADLDVMIGLVVEAALPGSPWRAIPSPHPYTLYGREVSALWRGRWVEINECGLAGPSVLARAGLAVPEWTGLAMGLGVDRLVMLRKGVPDIRLLRSEDPRVADQMLDLAPYRPVSHMPPVRRDLSVVVGPDVDTTAEALGDRVREALGADADVGETVEVLSETAYDALPVSARGRLGIAPAQRNVLVRLVLRALDRTLSDTEANVLRDKVYAELHEGSVAQWAAR